MPIGNFSLAPPTGYSSPTFFNNTYDLCLLNAKNGLERLKYSDPFREIELDRIADNLNCGMEKYGKDKRIKKNPTEDQLDFIGRIINKLSFFQQFFRINDAEEAKPNLIQTQVLRR